MRLRPPRVVRFVRLLALLQGPSDRARLLGVKLALRVPAFRRRAGDRPLSLRLRPLRGASFQIRPARQDLATLIHAFIEGQHLPPADVANRDLVVICELGANVGASVAALAARYEAATVLGVEPDPGNAALARANTRAFGERCSILELAVWDRECSLELAGPATDALAARPVEGEPTVGTTRVRAVTLDALLTAALPDREIDYLHMCIEGSEQRVLAAGGAWAERVHSIRVELYPHLGFGAAECIAALERLGFRAWAEDDPNSLGYGFGVRGDAAEPRSASAAS